VLAAAAVPVAVHLGTAAVLIVVLVLAAARSLLPAAVADAPHDAAGEAPVRLSSVPRLLRVLVPIALLGILCVTVQGSAATWSAVYLTEVLGQPEGLAATAFVVYMAAMVLGRMTNDRWVDRWGPTAVVRVGALLCVLALVAVMAAAPLVLVPLAFAGFALIGLGSSPMFPVMIGAAGTRHGIPSGHGVALVAWLVRVGLIFAPAMVGAAADAWGLAAAFAIPLAAAIAIVVLAPVLSGASLRQPRAEPAAT
jgi:fucose permease